MNHSQRQSSPGQIVQISRSDRWQVYQRLQELSIFCQPTEDGYLRVEAASLTEILLVRSVIQQVTAPRQVLAGWLDRCWSVK